MVAQTFVDGLSSVTCSKLIKDQVSIKVASRDFDTLIATGLQSTTRQPEGTEADMLTRHFREYFKRKLV